MRRITSVCLLLALLMTGCGGVSKEEYDAMVQERDALEAELQKLRDEPDTVAVTIKGNFTATVRALIPDYVSDDQTPRMAVVTLFQSTPFTIYSGSFTERLEVGETYVFEIKEKTVEVSTEEYERNFPAPEGMLLWVSDFREAGESDCGLDSVHLEYELCE